MAPHPTRHDRAVNILITGGTGSFGQHATRTLLERDDVHRIAIYSRDELKQSQMRNELRDDRLRFFIGDIRDRNRLQRALAETTHVIHAAALKQVDSCEYNPIEAVRTNIDGTANVIDAALDQNVRNVILVGTDKAVDPTNLYGATKLAAEKLIVHANNYSGSNGTRFAATRYGNVLNSRGSVLPLFRMQHKLELPLTVTDPHMTRFVLTLDQGVRFVLDRLWDMNGGEVFAPRLPSVTVTQLAEVATWPDPPNIRIVGRRPGEKTHELLISQHEADRVVERRRDHFAILLEQQGGWDGSYDSDTAEQLTTKQLINLVEGYT